MTEQTNPLDRLAAHFRTLAADHGRDSTALGHTAEFAVESAIAAAAFDEAATAVDTVQRGDSLSTEFQSLTASSGGLSGEPEHQPREQSVPCRDCHRPTWNID